MAIPGAFAAALAAFGYLSVRQHDVMFASFLGAAAVAATWAVALFVSATRAGRSLTISLAPKKQHWVQVIAQLMVFAWWGWHVRIVIAFMPFIVAQVLFAYAVDALLNWSRRDHYAMGFGPVPVVLSINLFLWFRPEWFYWQFAMILVGFLAKELIRWQRDGRSAHVFNPSSFPLAVGSVVLIATGGSDATFGDLIANTQFDPPHMYLLLFLAAVPGQFLFGVARMTMSAVVTMMAISGVFFAATGTYLFYDAHIPVPVFLGMLLLFTDPSTSPRSEMGRILFGMLYSVLTVGLFFVLPLIGAPTFYDKLLPVPLMNLMVRRIDALATWKGLGFLDPSRIGRGLSPARRNVAWASIWVMVFAALYATQGMGDRHPGQYLPFWQEACAEGSQRACRYEEYLTLVYCNNGSGWACNEIGVRLAQARRDPAEMFGRGCEQGFSTACDNRALAEAGSAAVSRAGPDFADLPIVLRGTKPALTERDPGRLLALACRQGWPDSCEAGGS
jgi:hypothetical protein